MGITRGHSAPPAPHQSVRRRRRRAVWNAVGAPPRDRRPDRGDCQPAAAALAAGRAGSRHRLAKTRHQLFAALRRGACGKLLMAERSWEQAIHRPVLDGASPGSFRRPFLLKLAMNPDPLLRACRIEALSASCDPHRLGTCFWKTPIDQHQTAPHPDGRNRGGPCRSSPRSHALWGMGQQAIDPWRSGR